MRKSLIIPAYNAEEKIGETLEKLHIFVKKEKDNWEILFVNDGSTDNTLKILMKFRPRFFKIISYMQNQGKGYAIKKGVLKATGDYIGFLDADLAYPFDDLKKAFQNLRDFDIVIGSRPLVSHRIREKFPRNVCGQGFRVLSNLILFSSYNKFQDLQCGLKVFRKRIAKYLFSKQKIKDWSFDSEILYLANKKKIQIKEIPAHLKKEHYSYKNSKINLLIDPIKMFFDIIKIKLRKYES